MLSRLPGPTREPRLGATATRVGEGSGEGNGSKRGGGEGGGGEDGDGEGSDGEGSGSEVDGKGIGGDCEAVKTMATK